MSENLSDVWFGSFIFWCLLIAFQAYLSFEHLTRSRYWQMLLGLTLLASSVFRLAFFALKWKQSEGVTFNIEIEVVSRLSMLLQSTSMSILFNLWFYFMLLQVKGVPGLRESLQQERINYYNRFRGGFIIFNIALYIGILSTVSRVDSVNYDINISLVTFFALIQSVFLIIMACLMGLVVIAEAIRKTSDDVTFQKFDKLPLSSKLVYLYKMTFNDSFESSFYIRERFILNSLFTMSIWICIIFVLRFIVMFTALIHIQINNGSNDDYNYKDYNLIVYPFFFYQIPDFLVYIILGFNISPSDGIYNRTIRPCLTNLFCLPICPMKTKVLRSTMGLSTKSANIGDSEFLDDGDIFDEFSNSSASSFVTMSPMNHGGSVINNSDISKLSITDLPDHLKTNVKQDESRPNPKLSISLEKSENRSSYYPDSSDIEAKVSTNNNPNPNQP